MDQRTVLVMLVAAILTHQGLHHEPLEVPTSPATPSLSLALREAIRIVDADLHSHRESKSGPGEQIGRDATEGRTSTDVSVA